MQLPNLKHLQYLIVLHQYQHFNKAAQACFISQSTLSSAVMKLEEELDCQLIERDHKSFIFTPQGEEIVAMAQKIINDVGDLVHYANAQGDTLAGQLTIGCIPTIAPFLLQDFASQAKKSIPKLSLFFKEDSTESLLVELEQGKIDLAIMALPMNVGSFKSKVLGRDNFYVAGDKALVNRFSDSQNYNALPDKSIFLLSHEHCLTEHAKSACKLTDSAKIHPFSATSLTTLIQMTAFHQGVTFLPEMAVKKGLGNNEGLTITTYNEHAYRDVGIVWRATSLRQQTFLKIGELISAMINDRN